MNVSSGKDNNDTNYRINIENVLRKQFSLLPIVALVTQCNTLAVPHIVADEAVISHNDK